MQKNKKTFKLSRDCQTKLKPKTLYKLIYCCWIDVLMFDEILHLETGPAIDQGASDGRLAGLHCGYRTGRTLGVVKGFEVGVELGFMRGLCEGVMEADFGDEKSKKDRLMNLCETLLTLIGEVPREMETAVVGVEHHHDEHTHNEEHDDTPDITATMRTLRSKFKLITVTLKLGKKFSFQQVMQNEKVVDKMFVDPSDW